MSFGLKQHFSGMFWHNDQKTFNRFVHGWLFLPGAKNMKLELFKSTERFGAFQKPLGGPNQPDNPIAKVLDVWEYKWPIRSLVLPAASCLDGDSIQMRCYLLSSVTLLIFYNIIFTQLQSSLKKHWRSVRHTPPQFRSSQDMWCCNTVLWLLSDFCGIGWVRIKHSVGDYVHFVKSSHLKLPKLIRSEANEIKLC